MKTTTLTSSALNTIDSFLKLPFPFIEADMRAGLNCPYYNNRRSGMRGGLRVLVGKGSAEEIVEEAELMALREKAPIKNFTVPDLKKFLVDHRLGIDCSGFAYYLLEAEHAGRNLGSFKRKISLAQSHGLSKFFAMLQPAKNMGVKSFAHPKNSREVSLGDITAGDFLTILGVNIGTDKDRAFDHMVVFHQIDHDDLGKPSRLHYTHSSKWPTDGLYDHGVRQGSIEVTDSTKPVTEQNWTEKHTFEEVKRAQNVSLRRLNWF